MSYKNKQILIASCSILALSFSYNVHAQLCSAPLSCEELGFTDTADKCDGDAMIKCPTDYSKVFCRAYPKPKTTKVCNTIGDILYDDKSCAIDVNNLDPNRTPIGVVFDVSRKLAIALEQSSPLQWASSYMDNPVLINYTSALRDYSGKNNTYFIILHGDNNNYQTPAADFCYDYSTSGTKQGDWYLPALGELQLIFKNLTILNTNLSKVGGTQFTTFTYYWSSSEYNKITAFSWFSTKDEDLSNKNSFFYVRPVLAY